MKSRWVQKQDQRILFIDLSNFGKNHREFEEELNQTVSTIGQEMYQQPQHSVLVLVDLTNTSMTSEANHLLSERITDTKKFVRKTAVVGMTGIRGVFWIILPGLPALKLSGSIMWMPPRSGC